MSDDYDERLAAQTAALAKYDFGAAISFGGGFGGLFGREAASCQTCGALVVLPQTAGDQDNPIQRHRRWHQPTLSPAPTAPPQEQAGARDA